MFSSGGMQLFLPILYLCITEHSSAEKTVTITVIMHPKLTWMIVLSCAALFRLYSTRCNLAEDILKNNYDT